MSNSDSIIRIRIEEKNSNTKDVDLSKIKSVKSSVVLKQNCEKKLNLVSPTLKTGIIKNKAETESDTVLETNFKKEEGK